MYHSSCQPLRHPVAFLSLRVSSARLAATEVLLCVQKGADRYSVTLSTEKVVSRLEMSKKEILRDTLPKTNELFSAIKSSSDHRLSPVDCFDGIAKAIHDLYRDKTLEHHDYVEHLECMNYYKDGLDVDGFETYLYLADFVSLARNFRVYRISDQTCELWKACWTNVQKLTKSLK